jgi:hypothetical protein
MRNGSWFHRHNLTLEQILCITYFWIYKVDQEFVKHELSISNQTIVDWYSYCREVCASILEKDSELIGRKEVVVEIYESTETCKKYSVTVIFYYVFHIKPHFFKTLFQSQFLFYFEEFCINKGRIKCSLTL